MPGNEELRQQFVSLSKPQWRKMSERRAATFLAENGVIGESRLLNDRDRDSIRSELKFKAEPESVAYHRAQ